MKASVVIPTYNSAELLSGCLESLCGQRLSAGMEFEVIVVDDGSTDATGAVAARFEPLLPTLRYVFLPRTADSSRATARNAGVALATGEVLILFDGDQLAGGDFVARHLTCHLGAQRRGVIGFRNYLAAPGGDIAAWCRDGDLSALPPVVRTDGRFALVERLGDLETSWHVFFSCNVSMRLLDYRAVGGCSDEFRGWGLEDSELGYRLARAGVRLHLDPCNVVFHQGAPEVDAERMYHGWLANLNVFMRLHDYPVDVVLQKLLIPFFEPARRQSWLDCYERFELAVRVAKGIVTPASVLR
jgi:glycosyltransferase involved in cell wall biosynthesis